MAIRKLTRDREGLDPIRLYGSLSPQSAAGADLHDEARLDEFTTRIRDSITGSLESAGRLHGIRVEALFRATLVAIGGFQLLTEEDAGDVYFDDTEGEVVPPDFRVVDSEGQQLMIEVKSVPPGRELKPFAMRAADVEARARYADLTGAPLLFALYWPRLNQWTLVPEEALGRNGNKRQIDVTDALMASQMARLGDAMIATKPPLTLTIELKTVEKPVRAGMATAEITEAVMSAAGAVLGDPLESNIAWTLLRYGSWETEERQTPYDDGASWRIEFVARPQGEEARELAERQGFIGIGMLSSLYSSLFNEVTVTEEGTVQELAHEPVPGMTGALIPPDYWEQPDRVLKLWRLDIHPSA